jgi:hypothetical protein
MVLLGGKGGGGGEIQGARRGSLYLGGCGGERMRHNLQEGATGDKRVITPVALNNADVP